MASAPRHAAVWRDDAGMAQLLERMDRQGVPTAYGDPDKVAQRTVWALSSRPRLAADEREQRTIAALMPELAADVRAAADDITAALRAWVGAGYPSRASAF